MKIVVLDQLVTTRVLCSIHYDQLVVVRIGGVEINLDGVCFVLNFITLTYTATIISLLRIVINIIDIYRSCTLELFC
jgi:hypothetical protein